MPPPGAVTSDVGEDVLLGRWLCPVLWRVSVRAKLVSLRIDVVRGVVVVTLPARAGGRAAPRRAGIALLRANAAWAAQRLGALAPAIILRDGAVLRLGDVPHAIRHAPETLGASFLADGEIVVTGPALSLPRRAMALLRAEAARRIQPRAARHAGLLGVTPRSIRLKDTRTRWGSCAPDGTLAFSWRLVMAPDWVMDYVVAHEVAHLRHMNHSPDFWAQVARLSPHQAAAHEWLRRHGPGLLRVG
jgi:predicted metal-dependent hydrolase